jgi:hypothetical protein
VLALFWRPGAVVNMGWPGVAALKSLAAQGKSQRQIGWWLHAVTSLSLTIPPDFLLSLVHDFVQFVSLIKYTIKW